MLEILLDLIFPRICVGCKRWGRFVCADCRGKIEYFSFQVCPYCERASLDGLTHPKCRKALGLDGMFVAVHYKGIIPKIIHEIKYKGYFAICSEAGEMIRENYHGKFTFDYFVPVPLHPNREHERGFNQAKKLAEAIGGFPVVGLLERTKSTKPQFDLTYEERQKNMVGAFSMARGWPACRQGRSLVAGKSYCLVDDVATTGATLFECAKVLKKAGAKKVWAICLARGG